MFRVFRGISREIPGARQSADICEVAIDLYSRELEASSVLRH